MQKCLLSLLLVAACAGCAHHRAAPAHTVAFAPNPSQVEALPDASVTRASLAAALPTFSRGASPVMISQRPVYSMEQGLSGVQRVSSKPVVAMTQYGNWLWYATDVDRDANTQAIQAFRSGYAVQKGGYLAWRW